MNSAALGSAKWVSVAAGTSHTLALDNQGRLWAWGCNSYGALGDGTTIDPGNTDRTTTPTLVNSAILGGAKWMSVAAGYDDTLALDDQGRLWAWGNNDAGQLGDGTNTSHSAPILVNSAVLGGAKWVSVAADRISR